MKKASLLLLFLTGIICASAQPKISFLAEHHNFGKINEADSVAETTFYFINTGNEGISLHQVEASCGCTTPAWSKDEVAPGDTGFVTATYHTINRPGRFNKTLNVHSNAGNALLSIKGYVIPEDVFLTEAYPYQVGKLRFSGKNIEMGEWSEKDTASYVLKVYNEGETSILFDSTAELPDYLRLDFDSSGIGAGETGHVKITFYPSERREIGYQKFPLKLRTDEKEDFEKLFLVSSKVLPFAEQAEGRRRAPSLIVEQEVYDLGEIKLNEKKRQEIYLKNNGKEELKIYKVEAVPTYIQVINFPDIIKPGHKEKVVISYDSTGKIGKDAKVISVYSNDPAGSEKKIGITTTIVKE